MKKLDAIVYIGRFQPFTNAHYRIVKQAVSKAKKLIIVIGSAKRSRSFRNPFTAEERQDMISSIKDLKKAKIEYILQPNSNYNFNWWIKDVQEQVSNRTNPGDKIGIIGYKKDSSSYYLNYFPQWEFIELPELEDGLSATSVRNLYFMDATAVIPNLAVPKDVNKWLEDWKNTNKTIFETIKDEKKFITNYKKQWDKAPFPPILVTTDAMVLCKGHILLIKRKCNPGKNLYAMPGGFLNPNEYLKECAIRELKEETKIDIEKGILRNSVELVKVYDDPYREARGRGITHCFLFNLRLKELPKVIGSDDAYGAQWIPLGDLDKMQDQFFGDHYQIIKNMLGQIN